MENRIEEQPYYSIFLDLIRHPYFGARQELAQCVADLVHQMGYRKLDNGGEAEIPFKAGVDAERERVIKEFAKLKDIRGE